MTLMLSQLNRIVSRECDSLYETKAPYIEVIQTSAKI